MTLHPHKQPKGGAVCALTSGGLDSGVLLHELAKGYQKVFPVYVRSGLVWEDAELYWLKRLLAKLQNGALQKIRIFHLPVHDLYGPHWSITGHDVPDHSSRDAKVYLPGRNLILLTKAAVFCALHRIDTIAVGSLKGNPFPDGSRRFFQRFGKALSEGLDFPLTILTPFLDCSKSDVIKRGEGLPLELTLSCLRPVGRYHCGVCNKCAERQKAFLEAGVEDCTPYALKGGKVPPQRRPRRSRAFAKLGLRSGCSP